MVEHSVVRAVGPAYWLFVVGGVCLAIWLGRTNKQKVFLALAVSALVLTPAAPSLFQSLAQRYKYQQAKALFDDRCGSAGVKIYQKANNVDGIRLLNVRSGRANADNFDPDWADAGLPHERGRDSYIASFLYWEHRQHPGRRGFLSSEAHSPSGYAVLPGYSFVDVQEADGTLYRYSLSAPPSSQLVRTQISGSPARFAVAFANSVEAQDRKYWVAGTTVTITDTETRALLATSTWYSMEPGQGSQGAARLPWEFAVTCPTLEGWSARAPTRFFVDQVIVPRGR